MDDRSSSPVKPVMAVVRGPAVALAVKAVVVGPSGLAPSSAMTGTSKPVPKRSRFPRAASGQAWSDPEPQAPNSSAPPADRCPQHRVPQQCRQDGGSADGTGTSDWPDRACSGQARTGVTRGWHPRGPSGVCVSRRDLSRAGAGSRLIVLGMGASGRRLGSDAARQLDRRRSLGLVGGGGGGGVPKGVSPQRRIAIASAASNLYPCVDAIARHAVERSEAVMAGKSWIRIARVRRDPTIPIRCLARSVAARPRRR